MISASAIKDKKLKDDYNKKYFFLIRLPVQSFMEIKIQEI